MALATQCPHCFTIFRVAGDQLKLRGGLVRCGSCKQVFNGNEYLVEAGVSDGYYHPAPGSQAQTRMAPIAPAAKPLPSPVFTSPGVLPEVNIPAPPPMAFAQPQPEPPVQAWQQPTFPPQSDVQPDFQPDFQAEPAPPLPVPQPEQIPAPIPLEPEPKVFRSPATPGYIPDLGAPPRLAPQPEPDEVVQETQIPGAEPPAVEAETEATPADPEPAPSATVHFDDPDALYAEPRLAADGAAEQHEQAPREAAPDEEDTEQPTDESEEAAEDAPSFVKVAQRRERLGQFVQMTLILLSALMVPVLLLQATYYWRNQLAATVPAMRPMLNGMCATFHCTVGLPAEIDRLSLESNELQVVPPNQNIYALSLVLRNRSSNPQAWPAIELTLNNDDEKPVVRRVFRPRDYLANPALVERGLAGENEQQIKLTFELDNALVSGYRIYLFYP